MITKYNNNCYVPAFRDDFFNDIVSRKYYGNDFASRPAVNISEEKDEFRIDLVAAGLKKEDILINLEDDVLTISSEKKESKDEKIENYTTREFNFASFKRRFQLPETVEQEGIRAEHENGVLQIHLPKKEESVKPGPRNIAIG